jgi:hypothetical protein
MTFEKFLQKRYTKEFKLKDILWGMTEDEIEAAVVEFCDRDFMKGCDCCDKETEHRVIHACNECDRNL